MRFGTELAEKTPHQKIFFDGHAGPELAAFRHQAYVPADAITCRKGSNVIAVEQQPALFCPKHPGNGIE
jgi:hypothetical protein